MLKQTLCMLLLIFASLSFAQESELEIIPLNYRAAEEMLPLIAPLLDASDRIAADGNNLIVRASPQRMGEIRALLAQLDTRPHNLLITVLQGQNLSAEELNAHADVAIAMPLHKPSDTSARIRGQFYESQISNNIGNTQTLRTLEGQSAYIKTGQTQPLPSAMISKAGSYPAVVGSTAMIEATTGFAVTPCLSGNVVTISVSPWSDRFQNYGAIATQSAATNLRAKLGEWIEIGGTQQASQYRQDGTLSRIRAKRDSEVHILIKVELID